MQTARRAYRKSPLDHSPEGLKYALDCSGLSRAQFATEVGKGYRADGKPLAQSYVAEILGGTRNANPRLIGVMARVLNCPRVIIEAKREVGAT